MVDTTTLTEAPPLLEVRDVTVRFGGVVALDELSFGIQEGAICGLIGPNGAGKTTCFNVVSRLYEADVRPRVLRRARPPGEAGPPDRQRRHRPHVPEPRAVPVDDAARERDGRRPQPGLDRVRRGRRSGCRRGARSARRGRGPTSCSTELGLARARVPPCRRPAVRHAQAPGARPCARRAAAVPAPRRARLGPHPRRGRRARRHHQADPRRRSASPCCSSSTTWRW